MAEPIGEPDDVPAEGPLQDAGNAATTPTSESAMRPGRIVVGVDGSEPSIEALRWAGRQASLTGSALEAVMAWEMPSHWGWGGMPGLPEDFDMDEPAAQALADAVGKALPAEQAKSVNQVIVMGNPTEAILDRADGAELIVMGARGLGTFRATLLGSVSQSVMLHSSCPVVVVRGAAEQSGASGQ